MQKIEYAKSFQKDLRKWRKSGLSMKPFEEFVHTIKNVWPPPAKYEAHLLSGEHEGIWDIHLRQNWIILLRLKDGTIYLLRMGTHAELGL